MNVPTTIAAFLAALAATFGIALAVGDQVGPNGKPAEAHGTEHADDKTAKATSKPKLPGGLMTSENGYRLALSKTEASAGKARQIEFAIEGPRGKAVTDYDVEHEKKLHLIVVRRDFTGFQHVHPTLDTDGTWTAGADLTPGQWRVFADFKAKGADALTLGADLAVPGNVDAVPELPEKRTATVDGYTVTLAGDLAAGADSKLTLSVTKNGNPVTNLDPYLGAFGHLVALREGDLAYLHVHPGGEPGDGKTKPGPDIEFGAEVPSSGGYHLYLDFKHEGVVRTAQFKVNTTGSTDVTGSSTEDAGTHGGH